jgi:hypothetical protein
MFYTTVSRYKNTTASEYFIIPTKFMNTATTAQST